MSGFTFSPPTSPPDPFEATDEMLDRAVDELLKDTTAISLFETRMEMAGRELADGSDDYRKDFEDVMSEEVIAKAVDLFYNN